MVFSYPKWHGLAKTQHGRGSLCGVDFAFKKLELVFAASVAHIVGIGVVVYFKI
jgi:hypothetical protein